MSRYNDRGRLNAVRDLRPVIFRNVAQLRQIERSRARRTIARNLGLVARDDLLFLRKRRLRRFAYENRTFVNLGITEQIVNHIDGNTRPRPIAIAAMRGRLQGRRYRRSPWYPTGTSPMTDYNFIMWKKFRIPRA